MVLRSINYEFNITQMGIFKSHKERPYILLDFWPFLAFKKKKRLWIFSINIARILWFFWDLGLTLFDSAKDVVFAEILFFGNILVFRRINWAQIWTKTINFGYIPFLPKLKFLNFFWNSVFVILTTTSSLASSDYFNLIWLYLWEQAPKSPPKRALYGCWISTRTFKNL